MRSNTQVEPNSVEVALRIGLDTAETLGERMKHNHTDERGSHEGIDVQAVRMP